MFNSVFLYWFVLLDYCVEFGMLRFCFDCRVDKLVLLCYFGFICDKYYGYIEVFEIKVIIDEILEEWIF